MAFWFWRSIQGKLVAIALRWVNFLFGARNGLSFSLGSAAAVWVNLQPL
jgi:hypothetical protein